MNNHQHCHKCNHGQHTLASFVAEHPAETLAAFTTVTLVVAGIRDKMSNINPLVMFLPAISIKNIIKGVGVIFAVTEITGVTGITEKINEAVKYLQESVHTHDEKCEHHSNGKQEEVSADMQKPIDDVITVFPENSSFED